MHSPPHTPTIHGSPFIHLSPLTLTTIPHTVTSNSYTSNAISVNRKNWKYMEWMALLVTSEENIPETYVVYGHIKQRVFVNLCKKVRRSSSVLGYFMPGSWRNYCTRRPTDMSSSLDLRTYKQLSGIRLPPTTCHSTLITTSRNGLLLYYFLHGGDP